MSLRNVFSPNRTLGEKAREFCLLFDHVKM